MSTECQRNYSLVVPSPGTPPNVDAYWTFTESGVAIPRVDKVHAIALTPNAGAIIDAQPGRVGNGLGFAEKGNGVTSNFTTIQTTQLGIQTANGWSWCFWFKVLDWTASWNQAPVTLWGDTHGTFAITAVWDPSDLALFCQTGTNPNTFFVQFSDNNGHLYGIHQAVTLGAWNFCHIFFDPIAVKVGIQMNNGAFTYASQCAGPVAPPAYNGPPSNGSNLTISQQWGAADTAVIPVVIDEMLLNLSRILNPSELTYLYNGGVGRTWPLT